LSEIFVTRIGIVKGSSSILKVRRLLKKEIHFEGEMHNNADEVVMVVVPLKSLLLAKGDSSSVDPSQLEEDIFDTVLSFPIQISLHSSNERENEIDEERSVKSNTYHACTSPQLK
jgi:hypothetical protein